MVLYATVIPFNSIETERFELSHEILKILINSVELILISYSLKAKSTFNEKEVGLKVLSVALAWTMADSVCSYMLYFLMNATGEEFRWEYIQSAIQANFDLIERIALVALVYSYEKLKVQGKWNLHIVMLLLGKYIYSGLAHRYIEILKSEDQWQQLIIKGISALVFGIVAKYFYLLIT